MTAGTLGAAPFTVEVLPRGGGGGTPLPARSGKATRLLDGTGEITVVVAATDQCCGVVSTIEPLANEIQVTRVGDVYPIVGPVENIEDARNGFKITGKDLSKHFDWRVFHADHEWVDADLATVTADTINDGLEGGPVVDNPGIGFDIAPTGVLYSGSVNAAVRGSISQGLRTPAQRGLDWTMLGRTFYARRHQSEPKPGLIDLSWFVTRPKIRRSARTYQSHVYTLGSVGVSGFGGTYDPRYGLVERVVADTTITNNFDADLRAESEVGQSTLGSFIDAGESGVLSPNAPITGDMLIPGCVWRVSLPGCPGVNQLLRLTIVQWQWNNERNQRRVQVGFEPVEGSELASVQAGRVLS